MEDQFQIKEEEKEPDFVVSLHVQNLAEALEDYFIKHGLFIQGDHFEKIFIPLDMSFVSEDLTFLFAAHVIPSAERVFREFSRGASPDFSSPSDPEELDGPIDPKKLN